MIFRLAKGGEGLYPEFSPEEKKALETSYEILMKCYKKSKHKKSNAFFKPAFKIYALLKNSERQEPVFPIEEKE